MCLIIYSGIGTNKKDPFLEEAIRKAHEFNGDGMGYAIKRSKDNSIFLSKGYNDVDEFIKQIKAQKVLVKDELLIHLRIGNKGAKNSEMCHPFIVSNDDDEITQLEGFTDKPVLAHNGTMHRHAVTNSLKSDTFHFIKNVMSKESVQRFMYDSPEDFSEVMQPHLNASRLAIMNSNEPTLLIGKWYKEKELYFSKDYYEEYFPKPAANYYDWRKGRYGISCDEWDDYYNNEYSYKSSYDNVQKVLNNFNDNELKISCLKPGVIAPKLEYDRLSFNDKFGFTYHSYMGLYLPEELTSTKFIPEINERNLNHFLLFAKHDNIPYGIKKTGHYSLSSVNNYTVTIFDHEDGDEVLMSNSEFYTIFKIVPTVEYHDVYQDLYEMVRGINVSKTCYKDLSKIVDRAIEKGWDNIDFRGGRNLELDAAIIFMEQMDKELLYRKEPFKLMF